MSRRERLSLFLLLSLFLHLLFLWGLVSFDMGEEKLAQQDWVEIDLLPQKRVRQTLVDLPKPEFQRRPDQSKFLGQFDSRAPEDQRRYKPSPFDVNPSQKESLSVADALKMAKRSEQDPRRLAMLPDPDDFVRKQQQDQNDKLRYLNVYEITPKAISEMTSLSKDDFVWDVKFGEQTFVNMEKF